MTIQKAIQSGKPFRRKPWWHTISCYLSNTEYRETIYIGIKPTTKRRYVPIASDILATDWEVKS